MTLTPVRIKDEARALGFLACGVTDLAPNGHARELDAWLANGYAATMRYLHRQASRRKDPGTIVPEARSVIVVLDNYYPGPAETGGPRIAKYARGTDYHQSLGKRLERLALFRRDQGARFTRVFVDAGPVPERELAQRAGLGWIGKNTMLIRPGVGSFFFIGSVFIDIELPPDAPYELDRCGSCTRCLEACPTQALVAPRVLDASRCISYQTIEYRGDFPEPVAAGLAGWAFGCDICNDVCPWNLSFAEVTAESEYLPRRDLPDAGADFFDAMSEEEFHQRFADTPLERPGLGGMRRNWRVALATAVRKNP